MDVRRYGTIGSTNLEAKRLFVEGAVSMADEAPLAIVAEEQAGGIGRDLRPWVSPRGGLWMSVLWPAKRPQGAYMSAPLVAGLAVRRAIRACCGVEADVKWPNDLLVGRGKLVGILCQTARSRGDGEAVIIGVGINGNFPASALGDGLRRPAATLLDECGREVDLAGLEALVLEAIEENLRLFEQEPLARPFAPFRAELDAALAWKGEAVAWSGPNETRRSGTVLGVDDAGRLLLDMDGKVETVLSGEIEHLDNGPAPR